MDQSGMWFYMSFADASRPTGEQFLGGVYVRVPDDPAKLALAEAQVRERRGAHSECADEQTVMLAAALTRSHELGINPGGEVSSVGPIPAEAIEANVPEADRERLLSKAELGE